MLGSESALEPIQRKLAGKSVGKRSLKFIRATTAAELKSCALVFVSDADKTQIPAALSEFKGRPILTVGESEGFAESGGILLYKIDGATSYSTTAPSFATAAIPLGPVKLRAEPGIARQFPDLWLLDLTVGAALAL